MAGTITDEFLDVAYSENKELGFHELEMKADAEMYEAKSKYYIDNKIDRRKT